METTRAVYLAWCKQRAIEYVDAGDLNNAVASMASDLRKHPATEISANGILFAMGMMEIRRGPDAVRRWVEGFN